MSPVQQSPTAVVVEGGGMRGIFSAGVLDAFQARAFNPFDLAIGCSAGACNLSSYLAGQFDRNRRCYTTQMSRPEFISAGRFFRGGHWLDLDYLWDAFLREDPLDVDAVVANRTRFIVTATAADTGQAAYMEPDADGMLEALRASSAVPVLYRKFVEIDGRPYTDGGVAASIPVEEAYRRGARRILVLRSRPASYLREPRFEAAAGAFVLRRHLALADTLRHSHEAYARAVDFIHHPPAGCEVTQVAPVRALRSTRARASLAALAHDYQQGRLAGEAAMRQWEAREPALQRKAG
jgi:predicted patatin/cPLA2 family phospholipase